MSAALKYTDRDVRENRELTAAAYRYVETYQGEFQFLVDCKMRVASNEELTVGLVRGILNCMRVDPRVTGLPVPLPVGEGTVTQIRSKRKYKIKCDRTDFHDPHDGDEDTYNCYGIFELNRQPFRRDVTLKTGLDYVAAKSPTALMHKMPYEAQQESWCIWYPFPHEPGFYMPPDFFTRPLCTFPRVIKNPILLTYDGYTEFQNDEETSRLRCERCFN